MSQLEIPEQFEFPFTPYQIQHDFMHTLFDTLENGNCGIFESPTGTGKSLSIICGALKWLREHNNHVQEQTDRKIIALTEEKQKLATDSSDWITSQSQEISITRELNLLKLEKTKVEEYSKKIENMKKGKASVRFDRSKFIKDKDQKQVVDVAEDNNADDDDDDDDLANLEMVNNTEVDDEEVSEESEHRPLQIFICSRTHSQLSQLLGEIRKSPYGGDIRVVTLASRQNYCVNPAVLKLKNNFLINERCLDLQKSQSKTTKNDEDGKAVKRKKENGCKCPYFKQQPIEELRDVVLFDLPDIEDLLIAARETKACPYYASRKAVKDAEVVLVPYNTILHKPTREANGIELKGNVVIIDEAHNLLEALAQMHGAEVSHEQLTHAQQQLKSYKLRYNTRFSAKNLLRINQLIFIVSKLKEELDKELQNKNNIKTEIMTLANFVNTAEIDNYNMHNLVKFAKESKLSQKLHGFVLKHADSIQTKKEEKKGIKNFLTTIENNSKKKEEIVEPVVVKKTKPSPANPLLSVIAFLEALTYSYQDGRILVHRENPKKLQFLLLNAGVHFKDIVKEVRSVIVAGGTMKPIEEFRDRLFVNSDVPLSKITQFSCDHIIPPNNILPITLGRGANQEKLLFNFENRFKMGNSIKAILKETCRLIKGGVVVFFPSYKYESWIWDQVKDINFGRQVFREPQESSSVDSVLENYHKAIYKSESRSALMFSVVGGKLSEGLNFSDDLGRCVIVVGLPYANIYSPELKEKMAYLDRVEGSGAGNQFYENLCMKAVNQCIGRAVRHKDDYATVLLLDERFDRTSTKNALPDWIKRSLRSCDYHGALAIIKKFFDDRK